ncbi:ABC transporter substrate-binding protein [Spirochaetia bacterium]|nr:ABC transporter substrate-binding protein [Spirochaetia bacterium]
MKKGILMALCVAVIGIQGVQAGGSGEGSSKAANDDYVIKIGIGISAGLCSAPFRIAEAKGFYAEEGLKFEEVKIDTNQAAQLLTTGQIDVTNMLLATTIVPLANGLDVKIPLGIHTGCVKILVPPKSNVKKPADLKGKKIGVPGMNTSGALIAQRYLASAGINVSAEKGEVEWLIYPATELALALQRGQVDAIAINDPTALIVEKNGIGVPIADTGKDNEMMNEFCCVVVAGTNVADKHIAALAKLTRAIQKASNWVHENPVETAQILEQTKYVPGDAATNAESLAAYDYRASVSEARVAITRNFKDMQAIGLVDKSVNVDKIAANTFLALPGVPDHL